MMTDPMLADTRRETAAGGPVITLTTDFGTRDGYVAAMKGVIAGLAPRARVVDICHEVGAQDVRHAGFVLWQTFRWFPPGSIHVAVVDPGVGTDRRILLGRYAGHYVIAPDNGLLTLIHQEYGTELLVVIENPAYFAKRVSATFHGRDIFAPVAAHLATGTAPENLGRPTDRIDLLPLAHRAELRGDRVVGGILHVDHFGTLVTNIHWDQLRSEVAGGGDGVVYCGGRRVGPVRSTFADVPIGEVLALVGSADLVEIAVHRGRAVDVFGDAAGLVIEIRNAPVGP